MSEALTQLQKDAFHKDGYLIFESFFSPDEIAGLKAAIDELGAIREKQRNGEPAPDLKFVFEVPALAELLRHPRMMAIIEDIMGPNFGFHHLHAVRQDPGAPGVNWHQDYEQHPQTNRSHIMVHVFYYLNGLNGEVGDLLVLPGSQYTIADRSAMGIFGQEDLPGSLTVDNVPPGTAIVVHSALWHARRKKPGGENRSRYFADSSYCQAGVRWPSYPNYGELLERAEKMGLLEGERAHLFNAEMFFDSGLAHKTVAKTQGSLALQLPTWEGAK